MESPIPPVPDRLVPQPRSRTERRNRREDRARERAFDLPAGTPGADAASTPEPEPRPHPHVHEDGVGERIDVTA